MKSLFNLVSSVGPPVMNAQQWPYIKHGLSANLARVVTFYRRHTMAVEAQHFLVRILQSISVPLSLPVERYYDNVDRMALNLSMALKMTSSIYAGAMFPGTFYGPGCSEVLIAQDESFDPVFADRNWENLSPVKVLRHPRSDLELNLPDGKKIGTEFGLAVIEINITLLAIQYRAWRKQEVDIAEETKDPQRTVMQFVHMYVLPNMMFSHLDYAIFNRISNLSRAKQSGESNVKHPFYITDFSEKADQALSIVLENLSKIGRDFNGILYNVPAVTKTSMREVLRLPDVLANRQVNWGLVVARLPAVRLLIDASKDGANTRNQSEVNTLLREFLQYKTDNSIRSMLTLRQYYEVANDINYIVKNLSS